MRLITACLYNLITDGHDYYSPEAKHSYGRIMEIFYGAKEWCSRVRL